MEESWIISDSVNFHTIYVFTINMLFLHPNLNIFRYLTSHLIDNSIFELGEMVISFDACKNINKNIVVKQQIGT